MRAARRSIRGRRVRVPHTGIWRRGGVAIVFVWGLMHSMAGAARQVSIRDLIETREISTPTLSPHGRHIAFLVEAKSIRTNVTHLTWYVQRLLPELRPARRIADGGVPMRDIAGPLIPPRASWSPDGKWIYFRARRYGEVQVWRAARRGGRMQEVTHDAADVVSFLLSPGGRKIYYTVRATRKAIAGAERREYERGVRLTPRVEVYEPVLYNERRDDGTRTTQRRSAKGAYELLENVKPRVRVTTIGGSALDATGADMAEYRKLRSAHVNEWYQLLYGFYFHRGEGLLPATRGGETAVWNKVSRSWKYPLAGLYQLEIRPGPHMRPLRCQAAACRAVIGHFSGAEWRPGSSDVIWASQTELGAGTLHEWNVRRGTVRTVFSSDDHLGGTAGVQRDLLMGCPITAGWAVCVTSAASSPPEIQEINLTTGSRRTVFDPNGALRERTFGAVRDLHWRDLWGQEHVGVLVLPPGLRPGRRLPLVIAGYHCRGFLESKSGRTVSPFALAEAGFAVLCADMDFRLASEAAARHAGGPGQQIRSLRIMLNSWKAGVNLLNDQGLIDESRIGVAGLSFGSESVWYALTHSSFIAAATVAQPPWMDPFNYFMYGTAAFNQFAFRGMPDPNTPNAGAFYARASVALNADRIAAPILMQGDEMEFISGMETYTELSRFGKPYEVYIFQDEHHVPQEPRRILVTQERNLDWFRFWLQGYEDPSPSKRAQYRRWERLCALQRREKGAHPTRCRVGGGGARVPVRGAG